MAIPDYFALARSNPMLSSGFGLLPQTNPGSFLNVPGINQWTPSTGPTQGTGTYWDPGSKSWHIYAPGVNLPPGAVVTPGFSTVPTFLDPATKITHQASTGVTVPSGVTVSPGSLWGSGTSSILAPYPGGPAAKGKGKKTKAAPTGTKTPSVKRSIPFQWLPEPTDPNAGGTGNADALKPWIDAVNNSSVYDYTPVTTTVPGLEDIPGLHGMAKMDPKFGKYLAQAENQYLNAYGGMTKDLQKLNASLDALPALEPQAAARATQIIKLQVANIVAQQNQQVKQANYVASEMRQAAQAAATLNTGIGDIVGKNYTNAGQALAAIGQGLGSQVGGIAANEQALAQNARLPGTPNTPVDIVGGVPSTGYASGIANALGALGGGITGQNLIQQAGLATKGAEGLSNMILGSGIQQARGAQAAGIQAANALEPQIVAAQNNFPVLEQQILDSLRTDRNATIDQKMTMFQTLAQIRQQQASGALDWAKLTYQEAKDAVSMVNAWNQADNTNRIGLATAQASASAADARANAAGIASANRATAQAKQDAIRNMFTAEKIINANSTRAKKAASKIDRLTWQNIVTNLDTWYRGKTTIPTSGPNANKRIQTVKPIGIARAWELLQRNNAPLLTLYGGWAQKVLFQALISTYKVPGWTPQDVIYGRGPNLQPDGTTKVGPPPPPGSSVSLANNPAAYATTTAATTGGGGLPFGSSGQLTNAQLQGLWIQAGGSPQLAPTMAAIALAESHGQFGTSGSINDNPKSGDYSVGPWQINYFGAKMRADRTARYGSPDQLNSDPLSNARAAVALATSGQGLKNWSTYKNGAYKSYLQSGVTPEYPGTESTASLTAAFGQPSYGLDLSPTKTISFSGPTEGINPSFMQKVEQAAASVGATSIVINPHGGKRSDSTHPGGVSNAQVGGVGNSNHLTGHAIDGYAVINGQNVPLGIALQSVVDQWGLRSGNVKGFYNGAPDPSHVDDGLNVRSGAYG